MIAVDGVLLLKYVYESNLIEGIIAGPGSPLYDDHLAAAQVAACGVVVHPNELHGLLTNRIPELRMFSGKYRTCDVYFGQNVMPRFEHVPKLMEQWLSLVREYELSDKNFDELARLLHDWLLCIHPYVDGNGRTARLVWNMLRVSKNLPWHIEEARTKFHYYERIIILEKHVFIKVYPDVY